MLFLGSSLTRSANGASPERALSTIFIDQCVYLEDLLHLDFEGDVVFEPLDLSFIQSSAQCVVNIEQKPEIGSSLTRSANGASPERALSTIFIDQCVYLEDLLQTI
jgi:hypothetical protein